MTVEQTNPTRAAVIEKDVKGTVFNIQRYSIQDGPGIRTTVFLKGCPLRCAWCSNPESQKSLPEIAHRDSLCNQCGRCVEVCKPEAISLAGKSVVINRLQCNNCGECVKVCSPGALKMFGETTTAADVFRQVMKDADFFRESGGGVTVSGGEPLSQPEFVAALFRMFQDEGIHTCIETCGMAGADALRRVLPYTSLFLFDIKLAGSASHRRWTQAPNEDIIRNLGIVDASGTPMVIRIPLIPGINDTKEELRNTAQLISRVVKNPVKVNLLPYHKFGMGKYRMLDREYSLEELVTQPDEQVREARRLFESFGFECEIEG